MAQHSLQQVVAELFISQALEYRVQMCTVSPILRPAEQSGAVIQASSRCVMRIPLRMLQAMPASSDRCTAVRVSDIKPSWYLPYAALTTASTVRGLAAEKKKNHYIFSSHLRADQMPGPPREGQLMCTLFQR